MIPFLDDAVSKRALTGGLIHGVWLVTDAEGTRRVVKTSSNVPDDLFAAEAEGLAALRASATIDTPAVVEVGPDFLVLEALEPAPGRDDDDFAERLGHAVARLHSVRGERFGWHRDNWLGSIRQINTWTDDGYEFFATNRILRYLPDPRVRAALDSTRLAEIERICQRLPRLVPPSYPALTHGDLWPGNIVARADGSPALIDPAVSWNWPGTDISAMLGSRVPDRFFRAYHEILAPEPGWREHLQLLHLREHLSALAHGGLGHTAATVDRITDLTRRYA